MFYKTFDISPCMPVLCCQHPVLSCMMFLNAISALRLWSSDDSLCSPFCHWMVALSRILSSLTTCPGQRHLFFAIRSTALAIFDFLRIFSFLTDSYMAFCVPSLFGVTVYVMCSTFIPWQITHWCWKRPFEFNWNFQFSEDMFDTFKFCIRLTDSPFYLAYLIFIS